MSPRLLPLLLLAMALCLSACGGGGGGNQDDDDNVVDPLARIEGSWRGTGLLGGNAFDMTIGSTGQLIQMLENGVPLDFEGTFRHVTNRLYAISLLLGNGQVQEWRFLLDPTEAYGAFVEGLGGSLIALQKNAATILPRTLADYAPGQYSGEAARFDAATSLLELGDCSIDVDTGAEFSGQFNTLSFASVPGSPLSLRFANGTVISGSSADNDATTNAILLFIVSCPDGNAFAFGGFDPASGRHVYMGLVRAP